MKYKEIYDYAFSHKSYNADSIDANPSYKMIKEWLTNNSGKTLIDVGCGRGLIAQRITEDFPELEVSTADLGTYHSLSIEHFELDMAGEGKEKITKIYDFLISNGVLEHIEKENLNQVLKWLASICQNAFIMTANHKDRCGKYTLHVTNESEEFWTELISKYFTIITEVNIKDIWFFYELQSKAITND